MKENHIIIGLVALIVMLLVLVIIGFSGEREIIPPFPPIGDPVNGNETYELCIGWNMVSMPQTISKYNVSITYNDNSYTWQDACDNGYIADMIISYNGTDYISSDTFHKTKGYWLYSLVEPLYISDEPFVIYCGKIFFNGTGNLSCNRLVIAPEYYTNVIYCESIAVADVVEFYFEGSVLQDG